jgi:hypothetical protein
MKKLFPSKHLLSCMVHLWVLTHIQVIRVVLILIFVSWEMKWFLQVLQQIQANHSWNFWANTSEPAKVLKVSEWWDTLFIASHWPLVHHQLMQITSHVKLNPELWYPLLEFLLHARYVSKVILDIATSPGLTAICSNETVKFVQVQ